VEDQDPHEGVILPCGLAIPALRRSGLVDSSAVPRRQLYRLRSRNDREIIREVEPGAVYVDRETGEEFTVVGKVLPLAPSPSNLPWSVENLRLCGCSLEQLAPKDVPDCPTCGRRLPAIEG
jgi:hypothetical protein